ncbi:hypothetical protein [Paenibacillus abyssi]|uniref:DUF1173 domain-containing protein n=2 Tax=Paenibacillus abyssi TaxID=1340531 RepID=A0A917G1F3_9BACL|nr:hypothetical protein [Paenibacillus abyssi]GGG17990.1 hypothetical protein GCM10010916_38450 [Paenibacillus abyssi]
MKFRDHAKAYHFKTLNEMSEKEKAKFAEVLLHWHKEGIHPECACKEQRPYPKLHVRKSKAGNLTLANNPNSNRGERTHDFQCWFNLPAEGYKGYLKQQGILIDEEGQIACSLKKPNIPTATGSQQSVKAGGEGGHVSGSVPAAGLNALRYLFLTWLQESHVHEYRPGGPRNVQGRLFRIAMKTKINGIQLTSSNFCIAGDQFRYNFAKHRVVIFWGDKFAHPATESKTSSYLVNLPAFSIADRTLHIQNVSLLKSVYEAATLTSRAVGTGYWVLYRQEDKSGKLVDTELIFEPADPDTLIPVESSYEAEMIKYLVKNTRHFKKPLVGNVTDMFLDHRPDMVLMDTTPKTIIEVAGYQDAEYRQKLAEKREKYLERGYQYVEWDGNSSIEKLTLPPKQ